jgi:hypothetical protein
MFVADMTDEFILVLNTLQAYDVSADVGRHVLRLGRDELPAREATAGTRPPPNESSRNGRTTGMLAMQDNRPSQGSLCNRRKNQRQQTDDGVDSQLLALVTLLPGEKRRTEALTANLEKQNKKLKAKLPELEDAQKTKMTAITAASEKENKATCELQKGTSTRFCRCRFLGPCSPEEEGAGW